MPQAFCSIYVIVTMTFAFSAGARRSTGRYLHSTGHDALKHFASGYNSDELEIKPASRAPHGRGLRSTAAASDRGVSHSHFAAGRADGDARPRWGVSVDTNKYRARPTGDDACRRAARKGRRPGQA
jgi:hypothetical protein